MSTKILEQGSSGGAPPSDLPVVRGPRGWRSWLVIALSLVVVAGMIAAGAFVSNYEPIQVGNYGLGLRPGVHVGDFSPPVGSDFELYRVPFREGQSLTWGYSIINNGPVGVTVTGIDGTPTDSAGPLRVTRILVGKQTEIREVSRRPDLFAPFHPFSLRPGSNGSCSSKAC